MHNRICLQNTFGVNDECVKQNVEVLEKMTGICKEIVTFKAKKRFSIELFMDIT